MTADEIVKKLEALANPANVDGMAYFGITTKKAFGLSTPETKRLAKEVKKQTDDPHALAAELWRTGIYEARAIAFLIDDPMRVSSSQMNSWVHDFDNWAVCDGACCYLFCRTPLAYEKVFEWAESEEEYVKRAAFSLIAYLAVHDKKSGDGEMIQFFPLIEAKSDDERNFVKKAVNWALRQIGKRNLNLNELAIESGERIKSRGTRAARWIAANALRELRNEKVRERLLARRHP